MITHDLHFENKTQVNSLMLMNTLDDSTDSADFVTKDILNHSDLQVMIYVYVGSELERHKLIVDTGSMVSHFNT